MNWLMEIHKPFFRSQEEAETWVDRELRAFVPDGWEIIHPAGARLTWFIQKKNPAPGEWQTQEYSLQISSGLDFLIFTHGNKDVGPFNIYHALHNALILEAFMLRRFSLSDCLKFLFTNCKPNEWGYT